MADSKAESKVEVTVSNQDEKLNNSEASQETKPEHKDESPKPRFKTNNVNAVFNRSTSEEAATARKDGAQEGKSSAARGVFTLSAKTTAQNASATASTATTPEPSVPSESRAASVPVPTSAAAPNSSSTGADSAKPDLESSSESKRAGTAGFKATSETPTATPAATPLPSAASVPVSAPAATSADAPAAAPTLSLDSMNTLNFNWADEEEDWSGPLPAQPKKSDAGVAATATAGATTATGKQSTPTPAPSSPGTQNAEPGPVWGTRHPPAAKPLSEVMKEEAMHKQHAGNQNGFRNDPSNGFTNRGTHHAYHQHPIEHGSGGLDRFRIGQVRSFAPRDVDAGLPAQNSFSRSRSHSSSSQFMQQQRPVDFGAPAAPESPFDELRSFKESQAELAKKEEERLAALKEERERRKEEISAELARVRARREEEARKEKEKEERLAKLRANLLAKVQNSHQKTKESKEPKEPKESKESKEPKESKEFKEPKEPKESKEPKELKSGKGKGAKGSKEKEPKESKPKEPVESKEFQEKEGKYKFKSLRKNDDSEPFEKVDNWNKPKQSKPKPKPANSTTATAIETAALAAATTAAAAAAASTNTAAVSTAPASAATEAAELAEAEASGTDKPASRKSEKTGSESKFVFRNDKPLKPFKPANVEEPARDSQLGPQPSTKPSEPAAAPKSHASNAATAADSHDARETNPKAAAPIAAPTAVPIAAPIAAPTAAPDASFKNANGPVDASMSASNPAGVAAPITNNPANEYVVDLPTEDSTYGSFDAESLIQAPIRFVRKGKPSSAGGAHGAKPEKPFRSDRPKFAKFRDMRPDYESDARGFEKRSTFTDSRDHNNHKRSKSHFASRRGKLDSVPGQVA